MKTPTTVVKREAFLVNELLARAEVLFLALEIEPVQTQLLGYYLTAPNSGKSAEAYWRDGSYSIDEKPEKTFWSITIRGL